MSQKPGCYQPNASNYHRDDLKRECHQLIEEIARRPGYLKLLAGVKDYLAISAQYKASRAYGRRKNND